MTQAETSPKNNAKRLLSTSSQHRPPEGMRLYVVGDIHGRHDLLQNLMSLIASDAANISAPHIIFLGDYIDRGLNSRGVIDHLLQQKTDQHYFLQGNHEQVMHRVLTDYDTDLAINWMRFGGRETMLSYGVRPPLAPNLGAVKQMIDELRVAVPDAHKEFLAGLHNSLTFGDYFFCHAGVRPGVPLTAQTESDLLWIRADFMPHTGAYEKMIVHGHTITDDINALPNRIGVDTGAYATGCLTALVLEGSQQWALQTNR